jgi:hypothetical protein
MRNRNLHVDYAILRGDMLDHALINKNHPVAHAKQDPDFFGVRQPPSIENKLAAVAHIGKAEKKICLFLYKPVDTFLIGDVVIDERRELFVRVRLDLEGAAEGEARR